MNKRLRADREINRWHEGFMQIKEEWVNWLSVNAIHYNTVGDAWYAFRAQQLKPNLISKTKSWFEKTH